MSIAASQLRQLADAKDHLVALETYHGMERQADIRVRLAWDWGSACSGYKEMSAEVQKLIAPQLWDLMDEAVARQRAVVAELEAALIKEINS